MKFGVTDKGFVKKKMEDIAISIENKMRNKGYDSFEINPYSLEGVLCGVICSELADCWEVSQEVYFTRYFDTCTGLQLDRWGKNLNTPRILGKYATTTIEFKSDNTVIVPKNTYIRIKDTGLNYYTVSQLIIDNETRVGSVQAIAENTGTDYNSNIGTITELVNSISGIISLTNITPATGGDNIENDDLYRETLKIANRSKGGSTADAIQAQLRKTTGVNSVLVLENRTDSVDANGIGPGRFKCWIDGIASELVAKTIHKYGPLGIETEGDILYKVQNVSGQEVDIRFQEFEKIKLYVRVRIINSTSSVDQLKDSIKQQINDYIAFCNYSKARKIIHNQIETKAYNVDNGILELEATIGTDLNHLNKENIDIRSGQLFYTDIEVV
ncbi:baseplate J/gp47 family protein [uncultured Cetobacterium sp.]|uniref:baseplate J/gp47 family protein n=1 Tax=uncultured Cetobacterium sp. TaxID=527638 RepID=UPI0026023B7D|nr:baseplate J/gp47 family protein [uncultured Cetobacterium sp.]